MPVERIERPPIVAGTSRRGLTRAGAIVGCVGLCLLIAGCRRGPRRVASTVVFASASLTESFRALRAEFERRNTGTSIALHVAGTPRLVLQLREGAQADVLAVADEASMRAAIDLGHAVGQPRVFAQNQLAIVTPLGNPGGIDQLSDLAGSAPRVLLCGANVPAGRYARQAMRNAGLVPRSSSDEPSVNAVVSKVQLGEADAGVVYQTDARGAAGRVHSIAIPAAQNITARYPIVVLSSGRQAATASAFVEFVLSPAGRRILRSFGFECP